MTYIGRSEFIGVEESCCLGLLTERHCINRRWEVPIQMCPDVPSATHASLDLIDYQVTVVLGKKS